MSRLACALSALLFGVVFAACVDAPSPRSVAGAALKPSEGACGDFAHPCVLEGIEVRVQATPRTASAELGGAEIRS